MPNPALFSTIPLDTDGHEVHLTTFPVGELRDIIPFNELWALHPVEYHTIVMHGKEMKTPRWQQAYGHSYKYSGSKNNALPIPAALQVFLGWARRTSMSASTAYC